MSVDFTAVKKIVIPEGEVKQIADASGNVLWSGTSNVWKKYNATAAYSLKTSNDSYPNDTEPDEVYTGYTITSPTTYTKTGKKTWKSYDNFTVDNGIARLDGVDYYGYINKIYEDAGDTDEWDINAYKIVGINTTYLRGDYIEDVESDDENAYPANGYQDGYWYVKESS